MNDEIINNDRVKLVENQIESLAKFIRESDEPTSIAIHGTWGTGKTTIMKELRKKLDPNPGKKIAKSETNIKTIWVNAWELSQFGQGEYLPTLLADSIVLKIIGLMTWKKTESILKHIRVFFALAVFFIFFFVTLGVLNESNDYVVRAFVIIALFIVSFAITLFVIILCTRTRSERRLTSKGKIARAISAPLASIMAGKLVGSVFTNSFAAAHKEATFEYVKNLQNKKDILNVLVDELLGKLKKNKREQFIEKSSEGQQKKLEEKTNTKISKIISNRSKSKIIIFVDDLDRVPPIKAVEALEILNLFFQNTRVVFVVAIDYEIVSIGVEEKYSDTYDIKKNPRTFFEKVFQLEFEVPVNRYEITDLISYEFEKLSDDAAKQLSEDENEKFAKLARYSTYSNPRTVNRLVDAYSLAFDMYKKDKVLVEYYSGEKLSLLRLVIFSDLCMQLFREFYSLIRAVDSYKGYRINLEYLKNFREVKEVKFLFESHGKKIPNEIHDIASFMSVFHEELCIRGINKNGEDKEDCEKKVDKLLRRIHHLNPSVFIPKDPNNSVPEKYSLAGSHIIQLMEYDESTKELKLSEERYSSTENNLDELAIKIVQEAIKQEPKLIFEIKYASRLDAKTLKFKRKKLGQIRNIVNVIDEMDFYYSKEDISKIKLKKDVKTGPPYRKAYYHMDKGVIKFRNEEYVLIKGWRTEEIHQLRELLYMYDEVYYVPPTSESKQ